MNVLYQCNDKYAPYCGTSITSLFENNKDILQYDHKMVLTSNGKFIYHHTWKKMESTFSLNFSS